MKDFLVPLVKILVILAFVAKNSQNFIGFLSTILKNLAKDLGKKPQKSEKFLGKKTKTSSTGWG